MPVVITPVESYSVFGRCLKIANEKFEILVTTDIGPRIISLSTPGGENMLYNDTEGLRVTKGPFMDAYFGEGAEYRFYGGHRMWMAPQHDVKTNIPDNDPPEVELIENGAIFKPKQNDYIGEKSWMKVVMDPDKAEITVDCTFKNVGDKPLKMAVWQITQCAPGGLAIVPLTRKMPKLPAGFKPGEFPRPTGSPFSQRPMPGPDDYIEPDRLIALFAIADIQDTRFYADNSYITLVQEAEIRRPFKLGIANYDGWAMYINKDKVLKFKHEHVKGATYTDGGCSFEIYTDANFLEVETLGQYKELLPGDEVTHTEQISLFDALLPRPGARDSEALEAFVEKHL